ncbi:hypothetical protein FSC845_02570 [Francisella persica ATCC VR-331]|nr:hypothetical protein FSC845_02570 [Francisella persica ATCC VR-331]
MIVAKKLLIRGPILTDSGDTVLVTLVAWIDTGSFICGINLFLFLEVTGNIVLKDMLGLLVHLQLLIIISCLQSIKHLCLTWRICSACHG